MNPQGMQQYENNFYQTQVQPQLAQAQADLYANGQNSGSYSGAYMGQLAAMGALNKYNAGLGYAQQLYNNQLQGRSSYFNGGPSVAIGQNAANVQRGMGIAGLQSQNAGMLNNYNLGSAGMQNQYDLGAAGMQNNFNLSNYGNQLSAYGMNLQNQANRFGSIAGGLTNIFSGGLGLMGGRGTAGSFGGMGGTGGLGSFGGSSPLSNAVSGAATAGLNFI